MSDYPGSVYSPRTKQNKDGVIYDPDIPTTLFAQDITLLDAEVVAIETNLIDKINQAVKTTSSPQFFTVKLSNLTDGFLPYHVADATGLANSNIYYSGTNVGIGTTNPLSPLSVKGSTFSGAYNSFTGLLIDSSGVTAGSGNYGAGIEFTKLGNIGKKAGIVPVQTTADNDNLGLAFFVSQSGIQSDPMLEYMRISSAGLVGIGTTAPDYLLDLVSSAVQLQVGDSKTNATRKQSRIVNKHYTNAEEPLILIYGDSNTSASSIHIGGGTSVGNAATSIDFLTAANNTTTIGTQRMVINSSGYVGIANDSPANLLDIGKAGTTLGTLRLEGNTSGYVQLQPSAAAGSITLTLPSALPASKDLPLICSTSCVFSFNNQSVSTTSSPTFAGLTLDPENSSNKFVGGIYIKSASFGYGSDSPLGLYTALDGEIIIDVYVHIDQTWDGTGNFTIGDASDPDGFITTSNYNKSSVGYYGINMGYTGSVDGRGAYLSGLAGGVYYPKRKIYAAKTTINAYVTAGTSTQGIATAYIVVQKIK